MAKEYRMLKKNLMQKEHESLILCIYIQSDSASRWVHFTDHWLVRIMDHSIKIM